MGLGPPAERSQGPPVLLRSRSLPPSTVCDLDRREINEGEACSHTEWVRLLSSKCRTRLTMFTAGGVQNSSSISSCVSSPSSSRIHSLWPMGPTSLLSAPLPSSSSVSFCSSTSPTPGRKLVSITGSGLSRIFGSSYWSDRLSPCL